MLDEFKRFISLKGSIKSNYVPYYVKWVSDCYSFLDPPDSTPISGNQKKQFLSYMAKTHEDWQVKQADAALRIYQYFLTQNHNIRQPESESVPEWNALEKEMVKALRLRQRAYSTEKTYITWLRGFRAFDRGKDPAHLEGRELQDFLSHMAVEKKISPSTQNQALNAIVFLFRNILKKDIEGEISAVRARQRRHLPVVLTLQEVHRIFDHISGLQRLMAMLIYGCGLRLKECLSLRIKDIDLDEGLIIVRSGKGDKDRRTVLPDALKDDLIHHIAEVRSLYDKDRENDINGVYLPGALEKKYSNAGKEWGW